MAEQLRSSPSVSENKDPRAMEYFLNDIHRFMRFVGTVTVDVGSIAAGGKQTFTIAVTGVRPDKGQTVQLGLPSAFNQSLVPWGFVSANDVVTVVFYNPTGAPIDPPSASYSVRVMP